MSLTGHIADKNSPVRDWLQHRLPNTGSNRFWIDVDFDAPATRLEGETGPIVFSVVDRWHPKTALVLPIVEKGYPWGGVGTAFDYRVRFLFEPPEPRKLVASRGALRLQVYFGVDRPLIAWRQLEHELAAFSSELTRSVLSDPARELHLCKLTYALALFEQCRRTTIGPNWPIVALGPNASLAEVLTLCREDVVDDIHRLIELLCSSQAELMQARAWHLNPRFAGSVALGGADADLIIDGCLLDLKTSKQAHPKRPELWQLAGYALADLDDEYGIERVGLYYARHGSLLSWPLAEFMNKLAGYPVELAQLRADFGSMLERITDPTRDQRPGH